MTKLEMIGGALVMVCLAALVMGAAMSRFASEDLNRLAVATSATRVGELRAATVKRDEFMVAIADPDKRARAEDLLRAVDAGDADTFLRLCTSRRSPEALALWMLLFAGLREREEESRDDG